MMRSRNKLVLLLGIIVIGLGIAALVWVGVVGFSTVETRTVEEVVNVADVTHISVTVETQDVYFHRIEGDEARIVSSGLPNDATFDIVVEGYTLTIETRTPLRLGINFGLFRQESRRLDVYLPVAMYESVEIHSTTGRVNISGFEIANLQVTTTTGNVEITDVTGEINAQATTGDLKINRDTIAQNINAQTTTGSIRVNLTREPEHANFNLSTTTGRTRIFGENMNTVRFGDGIYQVTLRATTGNITVE